MRMQSRAVFRFVFPILLLLMVSGCSCSPKAPAFVINPGAVALHVGERQSFDFQLIDKGGAHNLGGRWAVSPASGASVDSAGYFVATKPGHYVVTATDGSYSAQAEVDVVSATAGGAQSTQAATATPQAKAAVPVAPKSLFNNWNGLAVHGGGRSPKVVFKQPVKVTLISDYHWNDGHGKKPGTIALKSSDGTVFGPWHTTGADGQGGVRNAQWDAKPDVVLPAGTYTVVDSNPASWAQDGQSKGLGFVAVNGIVQ